MPSTVIRSFAYDDERQALVITFHSGRVYRYANVPQSVYLDMKAAFSKGEFFNAHVRDRYRFVALESAQPDSERPRE
jgi:hypothetical protein